MLKTAIILINIVKIRYSGLVKIFLLLLMSPLLLFRFYDIILLSLYIVKLFRSDKLISKSTASLLPVVERTSYPMQYTGSYNEVKETQYLYLAPKLFHFLEPTALSCD